MVSRKFILQGEMPMGKIVRELTEKETRGIRRLVTQKCANYDPEYGCLPLDCECVMLGKVYCGNAMCRYFRESVLPNDPELNASLQGLAAKRCKHCGKPFPANGRRIYCSDRCRNASQKKDTAVRVRKHRKKKAEV